MFDINYILNGTRKKVKPKKSRDPLMDLMIKPTGSIIGDRVTKQQKQVFKKAKKKRSLVPMFGDWDGDRVINGLDCQPRNKKKHNLHWTRMDPNKQKQMRDDIIDNHYKEKGYYKYGGPNYLQEKDLAKSTTLFTTNPIKKYVNLTQNEKRNYIPINRDQVTYEQQQVLNSGQDRFNDTDKDGVIDGLDCQPRNKKRHNDDDDLMRVARHTMKHPEETISDWEKGGEQRKERLEKYNKSIKDSKLELSDDERQNLNDSLDEFKKKEKKRTTTLNFNKNKPYPKW